MTMVVIMFLNNNKQVHVIILKQEEENIVALEDNNHLQIQCNKMRDLNAYLGELIVGHHLTINIFAKRRCNFYLNLSILHYFFSFTNQIS